MADFYGIFPLLFLLLTCTSTLLLVICILISSKQDEAAIFPSVMFNLYSGRYKANWRSYTTPAGITTGFIVILNGTLKM